MRRAAPLAAALAAGIALAGPVDAADPPQTTMTPGGNGVPIAVTQWGRTDGPGILLIHGFLASTLNWQKQIDGRLGERFRMAAVDMRGHGASAKPWDGREYLTTRPWADDVAAAIQSAGLRKPVIVAWSYGGFFAMDYVRHYGTQGISGIIFVGTHGGLLAPPKPSAPTPERTEQIRRSRSPNLRELSAWTDGYLKFLTASGPVSAEEHEMLKVSALLAPHYIRPFLRDRPTDNSDIVAKMDVPVLFIAGGTDNSVSVAAIREAAAKLGNARVSVFDGLGNTMFWYAPDRFDDEVAAFAAAVQAPTAPPSTK